MKLHSMMLGPLAVNCYIIETENKNAVAIDIGGNYSKLKAFLTEKELTLKKILLTHGHFDHIGGVADAVADTGAEVYIHTKDAEMLTSDSASLAQFVSRDPFKPVNNFTTIEEGDEITLDELTFRVMNTPGHTKGSVCYHCGENLFTGDTLFASSMGRTDFPGGSAQEMKNSLSRLSQINENLNVYPGHNESSTLDFEKKYNPYMKGLI